MASPEELYRKINLTINKIYKAPDVREGYVNLKRFLEAWDDASGSANQTDANKVFAELEGLERFLQAKSFKSHEDISSLMIQIFPELSFPQLPNTAQKVEIDLKPLEDARFVLEHRNMSDANKEIFRLFEEAFMKAVKNLQLFAKETEREHFRDHSSGIAGDLYRHFKEFADVFQKTVLCDVPWELLNNLALKLNNDLNKYNAAYLVVRAMSTLKVASPSRDIVSKIRKNETFFLRNAYWENLDNAISKSDYINVIFYVDRLLPLVDSKSEKKNLLMIKEDAMKRSEGLPWGCLFFGLLVLALFFMSERISILKRKKSYGDNKGQYQKKQENKQNTDQGNMERNLKALQKSFSVKNKTGLKEVRPPKQPISRKLSVAEIRYVLFQKKRIETLKGMELSPEEEVRLNSMLADWNDRCVLYRYNRKDREKADEDLKKNEKTIVEEAKELLKQWREAYEKSQIASESLQQNSLEGSGPRLLSLQNPEHVRRILTALSAAGFYQGGNFKEWSPDAKRALLEYKLVKFSVVDDKWDLETQKTLLGK